MKGSKKKLKSLKNPKKHGKKLNSTDNLPRGAVERIGEDPIFRKERRREHRTNRGQMNLSR